MKVIDLRSDTVTQPSASMKQAMFAAPLGDDVYGEDPTVNALEQKAAALLEKDAAIFCSSGTQSNLIALMAHCERGDEYIVGQDAHTYKYEAGGAAVLGSIQPQPLLFEDDGSLDLDKVESVIKPDDNHFAKSRLLCLENTQGGKVLPLDYIYQAREFVNQHQLGLHLDGARAFNAVVKLDTDIKTIAAPFDSVSICLSKGLGAPVGSLLVASESIINKARRIRKMLGGGMRQAGLLAAAGIYALDNNIERLRVDHHHGKMLSNELSLIEGVTLLEAVQTNMLFIKTNHQSQLISFLAEKNILISDDKTLRLVTHLDINRDDVKRIISAFNEFFSQAH
ncbi:MAG: threonine aldolase [Enterobacterales bacterium]|jgi:threonine aldolase